jgi:respiratory burst oxidase
MNGGGDVAVRAIKDVLGGGGSSAGSGDTQDATALLNRPAPSSAASGGLSSNLRAKRAHLGRIASGKRAAVPLSALLS